MKPQNATMGYYASKIESAEKNKPIMDGVIENKDSYGINTKQTLTAKEIYGSPFSTSREIKK